MFFVVVMCMLDSIINIVAYFKEFFDSFKEVVEMLRVVGSPPTLPLPLNCKSFFILSICYSFM